jgi:hypothetical protein
MESLPNELIMLIADWCDLPARKSLATVNFGLRALIWSNLPAFCAHKQDYNDVLWNITRIQYVIVVYNLTHPLINTISFRSYRNKQSVYISNFMCGYHTTIECLCIKDKYTAVKMNNYCKRYNIKNNYFGCIFSICVDFKLGHPLTAAIKVLQDWNYNAIKCIIAQ